MKGSTVDREASDKEKEKDLPKLKDNDFVKDGTKVSHTSTHSHKKEITTSAGIQLELQLRECFATQQILRRVINFALFRFARHFKFLISQKTTT